MAAENYKFCLLCRKLYMYATLFQLRIYVTAKIHPQNTLDNNKKLH